MRRPNPYYPLPTIHDAARKGRYLITYTALKDASQLGLGPDEIVSSVLAITEVDFYKSMPSRQRPEAFQDVYRPTQDGLHLYVKLQLDSRGKAVVISFKRDGGR